jgi:proteic killer suppression protein
VKQYYFALILSFKSKETNLIWKGEVSKKYPPQIQDIARRKLRMLNNSLSLNDLKIPLSNHLELLKGKRKGQYSIRINDQWRICFEWNNGNAHNVEIIDYH